MGERNQGFAIAKGVLDVVGGGLSVGAGMKKSPKKRRLDISEDFSEEAEINPEMLPAPTERRRGPFMAMMAVGGIMSITSSALGAAQEAQASADQAKIARLQRKAWQLKNTQDQLRREAEIAQVCDTPSTAQLECKLDQIGAQNLETQGIIIEGFDQTHGLLNAQSELIAEGFANMYGMMNKQHGIVMKAMNIQTWMLENNADALESITKVLERIEEKIDNIEQLLHWKGKLSRIHDIKEYRKVENPDSIATYNNVTWCDYVNQMISDKTLLAIRAWTVSSLFFTRAKPKVLRASGEEGLWTRCEKHIWKTRYTENFNAMKVLFEFVANRFVFTSGYDKVVHKNNNNHRVAMAKSYLDRLKEIDDLPSTGVIRCVGDKYSCAYNEMPRETPETITSIPTCKDNPDVTPTKKPTYPEWICSPRGCYNPTTGEFRYRG